MWAIWGLQNALKTVMLNICVKTKFKRTVFIRFFSPYKSPYCHFWAITWLHFFTKSHQFIPSLKCLSSFSADINNHLPFRELLFKIQWWIKIKFLPSFSSYRMSRFTQRCVTLGSKYCWLYASCDSKCHSESVQLVCLKRWENSRRDIPEECERARERQQIQINVMLCVGSRGGGVREQQAEKITGYKS